MTLEQAMAVLPKTPRVEAANLEDNYRLAAVRIFGGADNKLCCMAELDQIKPTKKVLHGGQTVEYVKPEYIILERVNLRGEYS